VGCIDWGLNDHHIDDHQAYTVCSGSGDSSYESHAVLKPLNDVLAAPHALQTLFDSLTEQVRLVLGGEDAHPPAIQASLDLRYRGQSFELTAPLQLPVIAGTLTGAGVAFHDAHRQRYGYAVPEQALEIVRLRVRGVLPDANLVLAAESSESSRAPEPEPAGTRLNPRPVWFDSHEPSAAACYNRADLRAGQHFDGLALVFQFDTTTVVAPGWRARVDQWRNLWLKR
jgi:N-methylhydantoinase A